MYFERERERESEREHKQGRGRERERKRENPKQHTLSAQSLMQGLNSQIARS